MYKYQYKYEREVYLGVKRTVTFLKSLVQTIDVYFKVESVNEFK